MLQEAERCQAEDKFTEKFDAGGKEKIGKASQDTLVWEKNLWPRRTGLRVPLTPS